MCNEMSERIDKSANGDRASEALLCRGSAQSVETAECNVALTLLETPPCDIIYFGKLRCRRETLLAQSIYFRIFTLLVPPLEGAVLLTAFPHLSSNGYSRTQNTQNQVVMLDITIIGGYNCAYRR